MLMYRCFYPNEPLLDLGMRFNISPTNKRIMDNEYGTFTLEEIAWSEAKIYPGDKPCAQRGNGDCRVLV
jgi:hypothetical protein